MLFKHCHRARWLAALCGALWLGMPAHAQTPAPAAPEATEAEAESASIPLTDIASAAERDLARVSALEAELSSRTDIEAIRAALPAFRREINVRLRENRKILASRSSVGSLHNLERDWVAIRKTPAAWRRTLDAAARRSEEQIVTVSQIETTWKDTQTAAAGDDSTPGAVRERIAETLRGVEAAHMSIDQTRSRILTLQDRVAEEDARVESEIEAIRKSRSEAMSRLLEKDSPSIRNFARTLTEGASSGEIADSFKAQWTALEAYAARRTETFVLHAATFAGLLVALLLLARRVRKWVQQEPALASSTKVFDIPVAMAAMLSLLLSPWIYPQAPRLWSAALSVAAWVPALLILRHVLKPALFTALNMLAVFFLFDQVREITASIAWGSRTLLLIEALAGVLMTVYLLRLGEIPQEERTAQPRFWHVMRTAYWLALSVFALSLLANLFGYVELSNILLSTLLSSAYSALFFYALLRIADAIVLSALRLYPLAGLRAVQHHGAAIRHRTLRILQLGAWILWSLDVLERLALRAPLFEWGARVLNARSDIGSLHVSLGDLIACALAITAAVLISRLVRFLLEEEVYPHLGLPRGVPYTLSRLLHYVILVVGFVIAIAAAGVDLTRFTILVSAFGVGVGFGLQQIINNFVSGLILLFERPVQVGDAVQIADIAGVIQRIGIRASIVRLGNGANVIVPNSNFITERVTNRTLTNPERSFEIRVGVAYGIDPQEVISLLRDVAARHEHVAKTPPPQVLFSEFAEHGVYFTLRANIDDPQHLMQTRSELGVAIDRLFADGRLGAPIRQRRSVEERAQ